MKTDVITVSGQGARIGDALNQVDKLAVYKELPPKSALHLRLLAEEMMGMVRAMTGQAESRFWIENQGDVYELHLKAETSVDPQMKDRLLSASTSGKNEAKPSFMERIRGFFIAGAEGEAYLSAPLLLPEMFAGSSTPSLDWEWSLSRYQDALSARAENNAAAAKEAWDELEKSVVAHVADDVKVAIRGRSVEMTVFKRLAQGE